MDMKGFAILTIAIIGIIVTFTSILAVAIPFFALKYHLAIELKEKYYYSNSELALLSLVSKKYNDTYSMYRVLSEHTVNGFDEDMQKSLKENIALLTSSNCSKLVNTTATILRQGNCEPAENSGEIYLFIPHNQDSLVEKIMLVYK